MLTKIKDKITCLAIVVMMAMSYSLSQDWQNWLMYSTIGGVLKWLLCTIEGHTFFNGIIVLLTCTLTFLIARRWANDKDIRSYRILLVLFALQLLWLKSPLRIPRLGGWLDYRWNGLFVSLLCNCSVKPVIVV